jgi:methionyl-tRNA synthetase
MLRRWLTRTNTAAYARRFAHHLVTTPIFYVNGDPHIGHLYSVILADAYAHFYSIKERSPLHLRNNTLVFSTGTDEHGTKVQKAANNESIQEYCDRVSNHFKSSFDEFNIRYTDYIRTTQSRHIQMVQQVWNTLLKSGDLYEGSYNGWYCTSDEAFHTNTQVIRDGDQVRSPVSGHLCEWVTEKTWKFKLSKYRSQLIEWLNNNTNIIVPRERHNEVLQMLSNMTDNDMDLSVSRPIERAKWGIPVPNNTEQTIYVWLDALCNYITVAPDMWSSSSSSNIVQVLGKDILKFHAIYWPALLMSLKLSLPNRLLVHSHWTVDHVKMSKSLNNVLSPEQAVTRVIELCGGHMNTSDARDYLRYYLLREGNLAQDSNLSQELLPQRILELADVIGNLLLRLFSKRMHSEPNSIKYDPSVLNSRDQMIIQPLNMLRNRITGAIQDEGDFRRAIEATLDVLRTCNQYVNTVQPWTMLKQGDMEQVERVKFIVAESLRSCALALYPVLPDKMTTLMHYLRGGPTTDPLDWSLDAIGFGNRGYATPIISIDPPKLFTK